MEKYNRLPSCLSASFAFYIAFYRGKKLEESGLIGERNGVEYTIHDDKEILAFYDEHKNDSNKDLTLAVMSNTRFWGQDLTKITGFADSVTACLDKIDAEGCYAVMKDLL